MEYELILSARSEEETIEAVIYYDQVNSDLGDIFLAELNEIYSKLAVTPQYYSFISSVRASQIRDIKLPSFPYVVIYEIRANTVYVISVMNCHKEPFIH